MIARWMALAHGFLRRRKIEGEIAEELRDHLEREMEKHRSRGVAPDEARRLALRDLGGLTRTLEATRDVRTTWLDGIARDAAYALRGLRRSPRFTATALALLVLGIGSTTAILSITYAVLVRPLPYPDANRLVFLTEDKGAGVAWPDFVDWRSRAQSFEGIAGSLADAAIVTTGELRRRFESRSVTANFFSVLGVRPAYGRLFDEADARPDAPPTVVVSYPFWAGQLGSDPKAVGRTLSFGGKNFRVIGVLPPGFRYLTPADLYRLVEAQVAENFRGMQSRTTRTTFYAVARLKPAVSIDAARSEMETIQAAIYASSVQGGGVELESLADRIVGKMGDSLAVIAGAVTLLLLITCVNLGGLLLNRSSGRAQEFKIRAAIGGSRRHLIRQLLVEHGLLISAGAILGAIAGAFMLFGLVRLAPRDLPRLDEIHLDWSVMAMLTALSGACAIAVGMLPILNSSGAAEQWLALRSGHGVSRRGSLLRSGLLVGEIALAIVLLCGSGLMIETMRRLSRVDPGFDPRSLQTVKFTLSGVAWPDERQKAAYPAILSRLRALPGADDAAITYSLPLLGSNWWSVFLPEGSTMEHWTARGEMPNAGMVPVSSGYFEMLRIPLLSGRYFDATDAAGSLPVVILTASAARRYFPAGDAIGKRIQQGYPNAPYGPWRTIVGIIGDIRQEGLDRETSRQVYMPAVQQTRSTMYAIVKSRRGVPVSAIERAIHDVDAGIPTFGDRTMSQIMHEASSLRRVAMIVLTAFGGVALLLATIGLYGVIAQGVADRQHEIGVRIALGATGGHVVRLVLSHALIIISIAVPVGFAVSVVAARSLSSLVFGIAVNDPATLGAVAAVLVGIALLASYLPARSASRLDPLTALRGE